MNRRGSACEHTRTDTARSPTRQTASKRPQCPALMLSPARPKERGVGARMDAHDPAHAVPGPRAAAASAECRRSSSRQLRRSGERRGRAGPRAAGTERARRHHGRGDGEDGRVGRTHCKRKPARRLPAAPGEVQPDEAGAARCPQRHHRLPAPASARRAPHQQPRCPLHGASPCIAGSRQRPETGPGAPRHRRVPAPRTHLDSAGASAGGAMMRRRGRDRRGPAVTGVTKKN
jgi:hypothetical protein